jgi:hypothetical protein
VASRQSPLLEVTVATAFFVDVKIKKFGRESATRLDGESIPCAKRSRKGGQTPFIPCMYTLPSPTRKNARAAVHLPE